ncbi:hypothetical protein K457DRAFT_135674 [Linnemannia elongata AG-77]|uniref:Uncharacterized protein n=1 Tax=Linnemannia elongata AG-77 TaxID=1314771 RepID=A0A197K619_9FUNG|nr:hypothetical protein K457DRAFT_135674 [Linnemannia elongata AG-77]
MDRGALERTITIWGTNISDGGLKLAIEMDWEYAMETIQPSLDETIRHRNAYYIFKGMYDRLDRTILDPCGKIYGIQGDPSELLSWCDERTRCKVLALSGDKDQALEALDRLEERDRRICISDILDLAPVKVAAAVYVKYGGSDKKIMERLSITDLSSIRSSLAEKVVQRFMDGSYEPQMGPRHRKILVSAGGFFKRNGMEEEYMEFLFTYVWQLDLDDLVTAIQMMDVPNKPNDRWRAIVARYNPDETSMVETLISSGCEKWVSYLAKLGFFIEAPDLGVEHVKEAIRVHGYGALEGLKRIYPRTVEDAMWIMDQDRFRVLVDAEDLFQPLIVEENMYFIPSKVDIDPYLCPHTCDECGFITNWMDYVDTCLYSMNRHGILPKE